MSKKSCTAIIMAITSAAGRAANSLVVSRGVAILFSSGSSAVTSI